MSVSVVRASSPADVLASIPFLLGYAPARCVVAVAVRDGRVEMGAQVALPEPGQDDLGVPAELVATLERVCPDVVLLVGYESVRGEAVDLIEAVTAALGGAGVVVGEAWLVCGAGWRHAAGSCCPPDHRVPDALNPAGLALRVATGCQPAASRDALVAQVGAGVRSAAVGYWADQFTARRPVSAVRAVRAWARLLDPGGPVSGRPDRDVALAAAGLTAPQWGTELRDVLIGLLCPGWVPMDVFDPVLVDALRGRLVPGSVPGEGQRAAPAVVDRLVQVAGALPDRYAPQVLVVLAVTGWWRGDGVIARIAVDRALGIDPGHRLAALMRDVLDAGLDPRTVPTWTVEQAPHG